MIAEIPPKITVSFKPNQIDSDQCDVQVSLTTATTLGFYPFSVVVVGS